MKLRNQKSSFIRAAGAFLASTKITYGIKDVVSAETDFGKVSDALKGNGSIGSDVNTVYYHVTDYIQKALNDLRANDKDYRIVVFVDDLDRCSPEKALEVLESIKSFFDIEGVVYVIGMDPNSIDNLIKKKYGSDSKINGLDYLKKIVQLPVQIPEWFHADIEAFIETTILEKLENSDLLGGLQRNKKIIVRAVEKNPREVKRFINTVILAQAIFNKPIDNLLIVQALRFRSEWNKLLNLMMSDDKKREFLEAYRVLYSPDSRERESGKGQIKQLYPDIEEKHDKFFERNNDLNKFLETKFENGIVETVIDKLYNINMEEYRRALESFRHKEDEK
jgi:hypothetical protein